MPIHKWCLHHPFPRKLSSMPGWQQLPHLHSAEHVWNKTDEKALAGLSASFSKTCDCIRKFLYFWNLSKYWLSLTFLWLSVCKWYGGRQAVCLASIGSVFMSFKESGPMKLSSWIYTKTEVFWHFQRTTF